MAWRKVFRTASEYLGRVRDPFTLPEERMLFRFASEADLALWDKFQDSDLGGKSTVSLDPSLDDPGTATMSGYFSTELDKEKAESAESRIQRSGFVGISSREAPEYMGLDEYDSLVFRVLGDGRKYIANIRTDNWIVGGQSHDVWQAFLFARKGEWQDVQIPFSRFLLTWRGKLVETQNEMNPDRILSVGISLAGGSKALQPPGSYSLGLDWIKACRLEGMLRREE